MTAGGKKVKIQKSKIKSQNYNSKFKRRGQAWIPASAGITEEKNGMTPALFVVPAPSLCHPRESGGPGLVFYNPRILKLESGIKAF